MNKYQQWREENGLTLLRGWAMEGLDQAAIAQRMGVSERTLRQWANRYPEIRQALDRGADVVDCQVEAALLRKALGYESTERKVEISPKGERKETETIKQVGPDVSAISLWLKKRKPTLWGEGGGLPAGENNLLERLQAEGDLDGIPELQPATAGDPDMVETDGATGV
jgi:transcriptional regulator with XRE-family HTH domain